MIKYVCNRLYKRVNTCVCALWVRFFCPSDTSSLCRIVSETLSCRYLGLPFLNEDGTTVGSTAGVVRGSWRRWFTVWNGVLGQRDQFVRHEEEPTESVSRIVPWLPLVCTGLREPREPPTQFSQRELNHPEIFWTEEVTSRYFICGVTPGSRVLPEVS